MKNLIDFLKKNKKNKEDFDINEILPKEVRPISESSSIKMKAKKYLIDNEDYLKKRGGLRCGMNKNNAYLDEQGTEILNNLIISLYQDNMDTCDEILNNESESEISFYNGLHKFLTIQLGLMEEACHKSWEESEHKNEYGVVTTLTNTLSEIKKAYEERELYVSSLSSSDALRTCCEHFNEHVLCDKQNFENELVK